MRYFLEAVGFAVCMGVVIIFMAIIMNWLQDRIEASKLDPMDPKNISDDIREIADRVDTLLDWAYDAADYADPDDGDPAYICGLLEDALYRLRESAKEVGAL